MRRPVVLVADDDPVVLGLIGDVMALEGCETITVPDGELALAALELGTPDLVILDVMLPGVSGIDVLRALRARPEMRYTPVLIVSAKRDEVSIWEGMRSGCDDYLTKPFDPNELACLVRRLLHPQARAV